jgi:hypothetical protein
MRKTAKDLLSMGVLDGDEIRAWIYEATTDELEDFLRVASLGEYQIPQVFFEDARAALQVRLARAALKPHWSITPNFFVAVIAGLATLAGVVIAWIELRGRSPAPANHAIQEKNKPASTNSPPSLSPKTKQ